MKNLILTLVATNSGWIARQLMKWTAVLSAMIATWLTAKGLSADESLIWATGISSGVLGLVELILSFVSRRYKVQEADKLKLDIEKMRGAAILIALLTCTVLLPSCTTTPDGQKAFLGITARQGVTILGNALKREAAPVASELLQARAETAARTAAKNPVNVNRL